jgi:hypothetical protein
VWKRIVKSGERKAQLEKCENVQVCKCANVNGQICGNAKQPGIAGRKSIR